MDRRRFRAESRASAARETARDRALVVIAAELATLAGRFFKEDAFLGGKEFLYRNDADKILARTRTTAAILTLLTALVVFFGTREMFGTGAAFIALTLLTFDPNLLAHGALITTDVGLACFMFLSVYLFYRFVKSPSALRLIVAGIAVGLVLAVKHTGLLVLPILFLLSFSQMGRALKTLGSLALITVIGCVVLWSVYGFRYAARPNGLQLNPPLAEYVKGLKPYEAWPISQLVKRIYNLVSPIDDSQPTATNITLMAGQSQSFSVTPLVTFSNTIKVDWLVDGVLQTSGTGFNVNNLISGDHVVEAVVKDNTPLVRRDMENLLSESRRWNLTVNAAPTPSPTPTPTPTPAPVLLLEENSNHGVALDSVTWLRDPISVFSTRNFSADGRTRVVLFAMNVELQAGENLSIVTAEAEDSQHAIYPLVVVDVRNVPNQTWMAQVVVLLPDNLANAGDVLVSIKVRGLQSNKVLVSIRPPP